MSSEAVASGGRIPLFSAVASVHQQLHDCGAETLALKIEIKHPEPSKLLSRLQDLRDRLLSDLGSLLQHD